MPVPFLVKTQFAPTTRVSRYSIQARVRLTRGSTPLRSPRQAFTFGNVGRNSVYGPGLQTLDLALQREFSVTKNVKLQIRAEAFNALNHTNLGTPNRFVNTPQFGTITEAATPGREIQLGVRLSF